MENMETEITFFKRLIEGVENSNHDAEQAMAKAYAALHGKENPDAEILQIKKLLSAAVNGPWELYMLQEARDLLDAN